MQQISAISSAMTEEMYLQSPNMKTDKRRPAEDDMRIPAEDD